MAAKRKSPTRRTATRKTAKPAAVQVISPCLWFDDQAEEAAKFYVAVFRKGRITRIERYPAVGQEIHKRPAGSVMTVEFVINGLPVMAMNGGPLFRFNEAISLQVLCRTQAEIDHYWTRLGEGGDPRAQQCGWLKDRFGLSWQIVPEGMGRMLKDHKSAGAQRAFAAMMEMKKLDIAQLQAAYKGK